MKETHIGCYKKKEQSSVYEYYTVCEIRVVDNQPDTIFFDCMTKTMCTGCVLLHFQEQMELRKLNPNPNPDYEREGNNG